MSYKISLSKAVEVTSFVPNANSYGSVEKVNKQSLTDGKKASADFTDGGWNRFYRALGREIVVDLGSVYAVEWVEAGFLHNKANDIYCPENVRVLMSENGRDYFPVTVVDAPYPASFGMAARARYSARFDVPYRARFVKLVFSVEVWVYCDDISVYGVECNGSEIELSGNAFCDISNNRFADRSSLGVCDIPQIPFGTLGERKFRIKREGFLPYLAYINSEGRISDTMFDSIALVPGRSSPFGGSFCREGSATNLDGWKFLLDELFAEGINLCALDEAVADLKKVLDMPADYKHRVYIAAPVPKISFEPFGDINGDGIEDKLITTEDLVNAYLWFVDETKRRFDLLGLKNIVIDGWLWNGKALSREYNDNEPEFVSACVTALHERGYKCIFAPFFQAGFSEKASEAGFDLTAMSDDVNFNSLLSQNVEGTVDDLSALCRKYGFGIEIELHDALTSSETAADFAKNLESVLRAAAKNGMMTDTVHLYKLSSVPGAVFRSAISTDNSIREIYDMLYRFIKGVPFEETAEVESVEDTIGEFTENPVIEPIVEFIATPVENPTEKIIEENIEDVIDEPVEATAEATAEEPEMIEEIPEIPEIPEIVEEALDETFDETTEETLEEIIEEPEVIEVIEETPAEPTNLGEEQLRYNLEPERVAPSVTNINIDLNSKPPCQKCCREDSGIDKKLVLGLGLGIAAAIGAIILISKIFRDEK